MKLEEYIAKAIRTESSLMPLTDEVAELGLTSRSFHAMLGLVGEVNELKNSRDTVNTIEELGDILWYIAIFLDDNPTLLRDGLDKNSDSITDIDNLEDRVIDILDQYKKTMYYGKVLNVKKVYELFTELVYQVNGIISNYEFSISDIMELNINKLMVRYPNKFNLNDAEVRNLDDEYVSIRVKLNF